MLNPFTFLFFVLAVLLISATESVAQGTAAQESVAQRIDRLKYRFEINDFDGISELYGPLFQQVVSREGSEITLPQKHLIAMATIEYHLQNGDHDQAIVPYLIAMQLQTQLKEKSLAPLVRSVDESFRMKHLPPVFFSEADRLLFRVELKKAIDNGSLLESEISANYSDADRTQLTPIQQRMFKAISAAKENPLPSDREILKLIEHYVGQLQQHQTLAYESLATAVEGLQRLKRNAEADRLRTVFQTQFANSRRLDR